MGRGGGYSSQITIRISAALWGVVFRPVWSEIGHTFCLISLKRGIFFNVLAEKGQRPKRSTLKNYLRVTGYPSSIFFFIQVHIYLDGADCKASTSLWLVVTVGAKAVDHSYLDGFSRRCLLKLDKKDPILSQKHLTLRDGNYGLLAPKLMRILSKDRNLNDRSF